MEIRILEPHEYDRLIGLMNNDDWIPSPLISRVAVAEMGREIVAFWVQQQVIHCEPVWIKPGFRNGLLPGKLSQMLERDVPLWAFADTQMVAGYLARLGFEEVPYKVFRRMPCLG